MNEVPLGRSSLNENKLHIDHQCKFCHEVVNASNKIYFFFRISEFGSAINETFCGFLYRKNNFQFFNSSNGGNYIFSPNI